MNQPNQPQDSGQQLQVKMTDDILTGVYANMVQVGHTPEEFILDFMNLFPPAGIVNARVIIAPGHMKRITAALAENIKKYEQQYGVIKDFPSTASPTTTSSTDHKYGFDTDKAN